MSVKIIRPRSLGTADDIHHLHPSEVEVFAKADNRKLSLSCADPCTNPMGTNPNPHPASLAFDGDVSTSYHNKWGTGITYGSEDHFLHLRIAGAGSKEEISKIVVHHAHPQKRRVIGATIELLADGAVVWSSTFQGDKAAYEFPIA